MAKLVHPISAKLASLSWQELVEQEAWLNEKIRSLLANLPDRPAPSNQERRSQATTFAGQLREHPPGRTSSRERPAESKIAEAGPMNGFAASACMDFALAPETNDSPVPTNALRSWTRK